MRKKILIILFLIVLFLIESMLFMVVHYDTYGAFSIGEWFAVLYHSLPHDITVAGYIMALPLLLELPRYFFPGRWHSIFMRSYLSLMLPIVMILWIIDVVLYGYWGFRLDISAFIYFAEAPMTCLSQMTLVQGVLVIPSILLIIAGSYYLAGWFYPIPKDVRPPRHTAKECLRQMLLLVIVYSISAVAIRGGVTESTMNIGRVYFSSATVLNHAATNPVFSLLYSMGKMQNPDDTYRFMSDDEMEKTWDDLMSHSDSTALKGLDLPLLTTDRPNIIILVFESFSGAHCTAITPEADPKAMPTINRLYNEGIGFTNFYANAWRTDRGMAAIFAALPPLPNYSLIKNQDRCDRLDFMSRRLAQEGYDLQFIHGGDVNFSNIKGFMVSAGFSDVIADRDFPADQRTSKWGVPDGYAFQRLLQEVKKSEKSGRPFFKTMLTLSSHEPFDVPYHHLNDEFLNSVAYADSCLNSFLTELRKTKVWDNTLVICLPDHCSAYPESLQLGEPLRYHIPMVWTGGAVRKPQRIDIMGQQTDLTATILSLMNLPHEEYPFSKDMFSSKHPHFAFFNYPDGFGLLTDSIRYMQDNENDGHPLYDSHDASHRAQHWGKAYLQKVQNVLLEK